MEQINWLEWGKEAFEKAKKENKPILLDISAVWCHWCHRLDQDTYSDPIIAKTINENFIPVRVDTDKRPDINERYNQGGWPTTAFLTPDGDVIAGATYVAPEHMKALLPQVKYFYGMQKEKIKSGVKKPDYREGAVTDDITDNVASYLKDAFDAVHGGFYYEPKFPMPEAIELAVALYRRSKDRKMLEIATKTLEGMYGIYDDVEGGFFRYSVTQDWTTPHYEKMLEVNAGLLRNYLYGFALTGSQDFRKTATGAAEYIRQKLMGDAFYGSQDADEEYYALELEDRRTRQEPYIDKTIYVAWNGKAILAFLDAYAILSDETCVADARRAADYLLAYCFDEKKGMCHYYDGKPHAFGMLADNVWMMLALSRMYQLTAEKRYLETAEKIAVYVIGNLKDKKGFFDRKQGEEDFGMLRERSKPITENSVAAMAFTELALLTGKNQYTDIAEGCLSIFTSSYRNYGVHSAVYALSVEKLLHGVHAVVAGEEEDKQLLMRLAAVPDPRITVQFTGMKEAGKKFGKPGIYICHGKACDRAETIDEALEKLRAL